MSVTPWPLLPPPDWPRRSARRLGMIVMPWPPPPQQLRPDPIQGPVAR
jgi:hypothetical protein